MVLIDVLAVLLMLLFIAFVITQVVMPIQNGTPLFPMFLKDNRQLQKDLTQVNHDIEVSEVSEVIENRKKRIKKPAVQG